MTNTLLKNTNIIIEYIFCNSITLYNNSKRYPWTYLYIEALQCFLHNTLVCIPLLLPDKMTNIHSNLNYSIDNVSNQEYVHIPVN